MQTLLDPVKWLEHFMPEKSIYKITRCILLAIFILFLAARILEYDLYFFKPLWVVETFIYVVFIIALLTREEPRVHSKGWKEIIVPLIASIFPFLLLITPPSGYITGNRLLLYMIFLFMTFTTLGTIWALWYLRRSFSITSEVRQLITGGPYCFTRHPMYFFELLTASAVMLWRFSAANMFLFCSFAAIQLFRASVEERKLFDYFGNDYLKFAKTRWWLLPLKKEMRERGF